ncbi:F-box protein-like protein [Tanacetum coccineum]
MMWPVKDSEFDVCASSISELVNERSAYRAEKWIKHVTSNTCLKELCLAIVLDITSFTLPDELFSCENLDTLSLKHDDTMDDLLTISKRKSEHLLMKAELFRKKNFRISSNPVIACVNLRVLELVDVHISEEVLHNLLSTSKLLEKINLQFLKGLKKIKVNNLCYLQELKVAPRRSKDILEIHDVPRNLRELNIDGVRMSDAFLNVINSDFPLLESLTLDIEICEVEIMDIRCVTLKRLKIRLMALYNQQVQVNGPKLLVFRYKCFIWPTFLFPTIVPEKIELRLKLIHPIDHMFILKMRETLEISSKFSIEIKSNLSTFIVPFDIDDARTPATNVEKLLFVRFPPTNLRDKSLLIDALFSICRPNQVEVSRLLAHNVANYLSVVEKKTGNVYWPNVEIRDPEDDGKWETLSTSSISLLDEWFHSQISLTRLRVAKEVMDETAGVAQQELHSESVSVDPTTLIDLEFLSLCKV